MRYWAIARLVSQLLELQKVLSIVKKAQCIEYGGGVKK